MKIHEYQAKELLKKYGVAVPRGIVARSPEEAYHAAKELGTEVVVSRHRYTRAAAARAAASRLPRAPTRRGSWPARYSA